MISKLNAIIRDGLDCEDCINRIHLSQNTEHSPLAEIPQIVWEQVTQLHIFGDVRNAASAGDGVQNPGCYMDSTKTWVLVVGAKRGQVDRILYRCGKKLTELDLRFLDHETLDIGNLTSLRALNISVMPRLEEINGLSHLSALENLALTFTAMGAQFDASSLPNLTCLDFTGNPGITGVAGLKELRNLEELDLSGTAVGPQLDLSGLTKLVRLRLVDTKKLKQLTGIEAPNALAYLDLACSGIGRLPDGLREQKNLVRMDLSNLSLEDLPDWLADMNMDFTACDDGINLRRTHVVGLEMGLFEDSDSQKKDFTAYQREIRDWFNSKASTKARLLNEARVVFLGDADSGKTTITSRLLENQNTGASVAAGYGVEVSSRAYHIDGRKVTVHFWDFDGQMILRSMYRMFMSQNALYVVALNALESRLDEKAKYWLNNIRIYAQEAPVLLVINKIDQNPNATMNERDLRSLFPNLTGVIRVSALNADADEFSQTVTEPLMKQIRDLATTNQMFPAAWFRFKEQLRLIDRPYLTAGQYADIQNKCGIPDDQGILLRDWFRDLGLLSYFDDSPLLSDHVIMWPEWLLNGIAALLRNSGSGHASGLVGHGDIRDLLTTESLRYSDKDIDCILELMRKFGLSVKLDDRTELIPTLAECTQPQIAADYIEAADVFEFQIEFEYLPEDVIHRLMILYKSDLDLESIWYTGARFRWPQNGLSAVVWSSEDLLRIHVRSDTDDPNSAINCINQIVDGVGEIQKDLGLKIRSRWIEYKSEGKRELFDYDMLMANLEADIPYLYSKQFKRIIDIQDILHHNDSGLEKSRQQLIRDVATTLRQIQGNHVYWDTPIDYRNTYIRDFLRAKGYFVSDQSLVGVSASGRRMGEIDLDIRREPSIPWTLCEAVRLTGNGMKTWSESLNRLLNNYNTLGLPFLMMISYIESPRQKFDRQVSQSWVHAECFAPDNYVLRSCERVSFEKDSHLDSQWLLVLKCEYEQNGYITAVYHFFIHMEGRGNSAQASQEEKGQQNPKERIKSLMFQPKRTQEAEQLLREAMTIMPGDVETHTLLGRLLAKQPGREAEAEQFLREAVALAPSQTEARTELGRMLSKQRGREQEAEHLLREAISIDPRQLHAQIELGRLLSKHPGREQEAEHFLREVISIDPGQLHARTELGRLLSRQPGRESEAESILREAISIDPKQISARTELAKLLSKQPGREQEAEKCFKEVLQINPNASFAYAELNRLSAQQDRTREATGVQRRAERKNK